MHPPFERTIARRDRKGTQKTIRKLPPNFQKSKRFSINLPDFFNEPSFQTPNDAAVSAISLAVPAAPPIGSETTLSTAEGDRLRAPVPHAPAPGPKTVWRSRRPARALAAWPRASRSACHAADRRRDNMIDGRRRSSLIIRSAPSRARAGGRLAPTEWPSPRAWLGARAEPSALV